MQLWTSEHAATLLPALALMIVIALALRKALGKRDISTRMIPFHVISVILLALEVGKQVTSLGRGYDLYHLPFHFCSLFIFVMPFMSVYKGKHVQAVRAIAASLCTSVFLMMLIYPSLIYSAWDIQNFLADPLAFHTVLFHNLIMVAFLLFLALDVQQPVQKGEWKSVAIFTLCFCIVSAAMAQLLQTNYNNFYSCNVPPIENLRLSLQESLGYVPTQILYVLAVTVADILFVQLSYWLYRLIKKVKLAVK